MAITLTKSAAEHIQAMLDKRGYGIGLQLDVKKDGCNGFGYVVDYADERRHNDQVFESHHVKVFVDTKNLPLLEGTKIDFIKGNVLNQGLEFHNPNAADTCGCGESFNLAPSVNE
ncbi:MAG: iron-sulfur cluster assembly accessory protein [Thiotrichaceae bacterium]